MAIRGLAGRLCVLNLLADRFVSFTSDTNIRTVMYTNFESRASDMHDQRERERENTQDG